MVASLAAIAIATAAGPSAEPPKPAPPIVSLSRPKPRRVPKHAKLSSKPKRRLVTTPNVRSSNA